MHFSVIQAGCLVSGWWTHRNQWSHQPAKNINWPCCRTTGWFGTSTYV